MTKKDIENINLELKWLWILVAIAFIAGVVALMGVIKYEYTTAEGTWECVEWETPHEFTKYKSDDCLFDGEKRSTVGNDLNWLVKHCKTIEVKENTCIKEQLVREVNE